MKTALASFKSFGAITFFFLFLKHQNKKGNKKKTKTREYGFCGAAVERQRQTVAVPHAVNDACESILAVRFHCVTGKERSHRGSAKQARHLEVFAQGSHPTQHPTLHKAESLQCHCSHISSLGVRDWDTVTHRRHMKQLE